MSIVVFSSALAQKARTLLHGGQAGKAHKIYLKLLELHPLSPAYWFQKGYAEQLLGEAGQATSSYRRVLHIAPKHPEVWNNLAIAYSDLGYTKAAIKAYKKAISLGIEQNDNCKEAVFNLIATYEQIGCPRDALAILDTFLNSCPDPSQETLNYKRALLRKCNIRLVPQHIEASFFTVNSP